MESLFLHLVNMSITAGWLVLAVMVLRLVFRRAPKWIHCLMWGMVALRLIFPVSIESDASLILSTETVPVDTFLYETPVIHSGVPMVDNVVNPIISDGFAPQPMNSVNPMQMVSMVTSYVWILGMVAMVLYALITTVRLRWRVRESVSLRDNIRLCDRIATPFILGLFRPRIYLPTTLADSDSASVVAHEQAHIRRCDHWWKPLGFLLLTIYWFNPILWVGYILLCRDIEAACDEKVIHHMDVAQRKAYSETLLACSAPRHLIAACPLAFGETGVKNRIKSVLHYKKPAFWIIIAAVVATAVAAVCLLTNPKTTVEDTHSNQPNSTNQTVSDVVTNENSWQTLGHVMPYAEASEVSGGASLEDYNKEKLQKILDEVEWSNDATIDTRLLYNAYFSLDGVTRYYVSLDTWGSSGYLYDGKQYAKLTEEQANTLDYLLFDGGSTMEANHVIYGNFAVWDQAERCFVLDVIEADDKAMIGKMIRVNIRNLPGKGLPYIGSLLKATYDGTVLSDTIYATSLPAPVDDVPKVDASAMVQSGTVTGQVIYVTDKAVMVNCYDKEHFDVVWVRFENNYPNPNPQKGEEYQVVYDGLSTETYPYQVTAKTMARLYSTPLNNGFISEEKAIKLAVDHWNVRLDEPDMVYGYYTTVYVIEKPTTDNPCYVMGSRRVDEQNGEPKNSALFNTLYIDAVTGEILSNTSE